MKGGGKKRRGGKREFGYGRKEVAGRQGALEEKRKSSRKKNGT